MRFLGFLLIAAGLFGLFKAPEMVAAIGSDVVAQITVFDRSEGGWSRGWKPGTASLDPSGNPHRIEIEASFLPSAIATLPVAGLALSISAKGETVLEGNFDIAMPGTSAMGNNPRSSTFTTPQFEIAQAGEYAISVVPEEAEDLEMSKVIARIRSNLAKTEEPGKAANRFKVPSILAILLGIALLGASALPRSRNRDKDVPPPPPPPPAQKWGRDATQ